MVLALRRAGHAARLDEPGQWLDGIGAGDDACLLLGQAPGYEPDQRALNLWWPAPGGAQPAPVFDHVLPDQPLPPATDQAAWDSIAAGILTVTQHLLSAERSA